MTFESRDIVVVGASAAGSGVALNLRRHGHQGPITLIGDENTLPYDRPPLSKGLLLGTATADSLLLTTREMLIENQIDIRMGVRGTGIDVSEHRLHLADGTTIGYAALVVATGASARTLPAAEGYANVLTLRTDRDAERIRGLLRPGTRVGVVGGGLIGLEVAATARTLGLEVTVVEPNPLPLADRLSEPVARWLLEQHRQRGVALHPGVGVEGFDGREGSVTAMRLTDGSTVEVDLVLVSIGAAPNVGWLGSSAVTVNNGLMCDEYHRAAEDVYAVGDVANLYHPSLGRHIRLENRANATEGAAHLAASLMGDPQPYNPVPFFWTDQYEYKVQAFGVFDRDAEPDLVYGSFDEDRWIVACRTGGRLTAVIARDRGKRLIEWRRQLQDQFTSHILVEEPK